MRRARRIEPLEQRGSEGRDARLMPITHYSSRTTNHASDEGSTIVIVKKNNAISRVILFSLLCFFALPVHSQDDPPPKPTGLTATAGDRQVTLSWDLPTNTASIDSWEYGFKLAGGQTNYNWYAIPGSSKYSWYAIPGSSSSTTSYIVTGLTNGSTYRFKIRAKNAVGVGPPSNSASATPATVPDAVGSLSATAGDREVVLTWTAPADDGGSSITGYEYQYSPGGSGWTAVSDATVTVSGLTNGTQYTFEVRAVNGVGEGTASSASATPVPATVPGAVGSLSATAGDRQVTLSWDLPTNTASIDSWEYGFKLAGGQIIIGTPSPAVVSIVGTPSPAVVAARPATS